jgi:hypothetical protein
LEALKNQKPEKVGDGIPGLESIQRNSQMAYSMTKKKKLDSIMKLELLTDLNPEDIKPIWVTYMKERGRLADMLSVIYFYLTRIIYHKKVIFQSKMNKVDEAKTAKL